MSAPRRLPDGAPGGARDPSEATALLLVLGLLSVGLIGWVDELAVEAARRLLPSLEWVARCRVSSLVVCAAIYLATGRGRSRPPLPPGSGRRALALAAAYLVPAAVAVLVLGIWVPRIDGPIDTTAFMVTGLAAE